MKGEIKQAELVNQRIKGDHRKRGGTICKGMGTHAIIQINQIAGKGTLFSGGEFTKIIPFEMFI